MIFLQQILNPVTKKVWLALLFCIFCLQLPAQNPIQKSIQFEGHTREYLLYTPHNPNAEKPTGLIICLHGLNGKMWDFFDKYDVSELANSINFAVLVPQALPEQDTKVLNVAESLEKIFGLKIPLGAVWGCGLRVKSVMNIIIPITLLNEELNKNVNDAAFINHIVTSTLDELPSVDSRNQFVFGTSMGGFMSYQYALNYGNSLAGLISICGSMGTDIKNTNAKVSLPICDFHSITDEVVRYNGQYYESNGAKVTLSQSKSSVIDFWVKKNEVSSTPIKEAVDYYPSTNKITVEKRTYNHPENEVIHYRIDGAKHDYYFKKEKSDCMDYNEEVIKFINAHSAKGNTGIWAVKPERWNVYPNPTTDIIYFNITEGQASVYDVNGKLVLSESLQSAQLDISSLSKGMYFIILESGGKKQSEKIIKI